MATTDLTINIIADETTTNAIAEYAEQRFCEVTICTLAQWLNTDYDTARDWVICKVAAFRGVSESEIAALIKDGE